jgi:uncharacterized protein YdeI (YjbR/CyaY-like superfamily)
MTRSGFNPQIDAYIAKAKKWRKELMKLRKIVLDCQLTEELKWGKPCYTFKNTNLIIIYGLKESCALAFFNGALLSDAHGLLVKPGPNSQAGRWIKFTNVQEVVEKESILKAYIYESIEAEKAGLKVKFKKNPEPIPEEFQTKLNEIPALRTAFEALTPGRQRGYILYFSAPKQSKTRESRIKKCARRILKGRGLNDP